MSAKIRKEEAQFDQETRQQYSDVFEKQETVLTEAELNERVIKFLEAKLIGTLATCSNNEPRSTPVRYRNDKFTIYIITEGGGKVHNIKQNSRVSFSVYGNYSGFRSVRGVQLWGKAEIIAPDDKNYEAAFGLMNLKEREDLKKLDAADVKPGMSIIKIIPERVRYLSVPEGILNREISFLG